MRPCFAFSNVAAADKAPAQLSIFDEIGFWGTQAKDFMSQLAAIKDAGQTAVIVDINSPGGDVFAGLTMYNGLRNSGLSITTRAMGLVASAATLPFLAGEKRVMPKNTSMMVHNPSTMAFGNADQMRETAEVLDKIGNSIGATYAARTGLSDDKVTELRSKDTWMSADEAKGYGFATEVTDEIKATAKFDLARADLPEHVARVFKAEAPAPEPDIDPDNPDATLPAASDESVVMQITAAAKAAGLDVYAPTFALACTDMEQARARILTARDIVALCSVLAKPEAARPLIVANKSLADARAALAAQAADQDDKTVTSSTPAVTNNGKTPVVTEGSRLWKEFRARKQAK